MNYLKIYCNLIRKAEKRTPPEGYTEKHHTFPVSIFGKNNRIVILSGREHYIAHALLEKTFIKRYGIKDKRTIKMTFAHTAMKGNSRYINSYLCESARKRRSESMKGKPLYIPNEKHKEQMRQRRLGTKATEETRKKMSEAHKGKKSPPKSEEWRKKHSERMEKNVGEKNHMYGKKHTEESKRKMSEANMGKKQTEKQKKATSKRTKEMWKNGIFSTSEYRETLSKSLCKKEYRITNKSGEVYYTNNIVKFAKDFAIDCSPLYKMAKGNLKYYKEWISVEVL